MVATKTTNNDTMQTQSTNCAQIRDAGVDHTDVGEKEKKYVAQIQSQIDNIRRSGQLDEANMKPIIQSTENKCKLELEFCFNE